MCYFKDIKQLNICPEVIISVFPEATKSMNFPFYPIKHIKPGLNFLMTLQQLHVLMCSFLTQHGDIYT